MQDEVTPKGFIKQVYISLVREQWKLGTLCDLYKMLAIKQSVIFANTRHKVRTLGRLHSVRDGRYAYDRNNYRRPREAF